MCKSGYHAKYKVALGMVLTEKKSEYALASLKRCEQNEQCEQRELGRGVDTTSDE